MAEINQQNIANYTSLANPGSVLPLLTSQPANYQTITGNTITPADTQRALSNIQEKTNIENKTKALEQKLPDVDSSFVQQLSFSGDINKLRDCMVLTLYSPSSNENPNLSNSPGELNRKIGQGISSIVGQGTSALSETVLPFGNDLKNNIIDTATKVVENKEATSGQIEKLNNEFYKEGTGGNKSKTIFLPLPKQINDIHSHNIDAFSNNPIVPIAGIISGALDKLSGGQGDGGGTKKFNAPGLGNYLMNNLQLAARKTFNPAVETLYRSPTPRNWQWNIEYSPTSKQEADDFIRIVEMLKQHSYPTQDLGGILYTFPGTIDFYFRINGEESKVLPKSLQKCFIKGVQLDYTQQGFYAHFKDGNPVTIILTLDIVETRLLDRTDITANGDPFEAVLSETGLTKEQVFKQYKPSIGGRPD
jgi:hypothetical protein